MTFNDFIFNFFFQIARRLKLMNIPEFSQMSGGQALEAAASKATDPTKFVFQNIMTQQRDCQFSFSGVYNQCMRHINKQEAQFGVDGSAVIPDVYDLCAAVQTVVTKHICHKTQRAMEFISSLDLFPKEKQTLVRQKTTSVSVSFFYLRFVLLTNVLDKSRWYRAEWRATIFWRELWRSFARKRASDSSERRPSCATTTA